jgi:hypothetical protein
MPIFRRAAIILIPNKRQRGTIPRAPHCRFESWRIDPHLPLSKQSLEIELKIVVIIFGDGRIET